MSDQHARRLLVFLLLAAVALAATIVKPFWEALFLAAVLAAALRRPMEGLSRALRGHRGVAAGVLTVALLVLALLPIAGLGAVLVARVAQGVQWLRDTIASQGVWALVERLPAPAQQAAREILQAMAHPQQQLESLGARTGQAAAAVGGVLAATGTALFQTGMMLIAFFFFLSDGDRLLDWLDRQVPLRTGQFRGLMHDFRQTSVSVLFATVGTAALQSVVALVGYLIARAPNVTFLTLVTFVLALIPAVGGTIMIVGVGVLLLLTGHVLAGVFLVIWGVAVVSLVDNLARPYLLKGGMELHGGLVFFALLGGVATFGGIGLLVGPLALTFLVAVLNLYRTEFGARGDPSDRAEPQP